MRSLPPKPWRLLAAPSGFTLVELLVALALAAIISVSIMFISSQARVAYEETSKKVEGASQFRFVFRQLEEDFRNWHATADLEFYTDGRGQGGRLNGHWDPGEEVPDTTDGLGRGVVDSGTIGQYDEFATLEQRHYVSREPGDVEDRVHDAYRVYFRSRVYIDGSMREANVEYALLDPSALKSSEAKRVPPPPARVAPDDVAGLTLFKVVRYFDVNPRLIQRPFDTPVVRRLIEVCSRVTDFRVEYMVEGGRAPPGFRTPEEEYRSPPEPAVRPRVEESLGVEGYPGYRKVFGYGSVRLDVQYPRAQLIPGLRADDGLAGAQSINRPLRFGFEDPQISFAQLVPGDKIFVFTETDRAEMARGGAAQATASARSVLAFPSGDYTVRANIAGLIEFEEDVDTTAWGMQRKTNMYYKAAYIPSAVRITLRLVDERGQNPKTMQREIWLRHRSH